MEQAIVRLNKLRLADHQINAKMKDTNNTANVEKNKEKKENVVKPLNQSQMSDTNIYQQNNIMAPPLPRPVYSNYAMFQPAPIAPHLG